MTRQIILDTETTGLDPLKGDRIIEVGCIEMVNRRLTGVHLHYYFNPDRLVEEAALKVHGITNEFLQDKPRFYEVVEELVNFLKGAELIIHNAEFDVGFINSEFSLLRRNGFGRIEEHCQILDTLALARQLHPGQRNSLDALCKRYQIDNSHRKLHGALLDAEILASVYLMMTGGQKHLFAEESNATPDANLNIQVASPKKNYQLRLVQATPTELAAHEAYFTREE